MSSNGASDPTPPPPAAAQRWPGWPGHNVYRMIVPVVKVGGIIGRKGELIKKLCQETRASVRILDSALQTNDRIVLISGKEEPEAEVSPAMDAVLRVFKCVNGISENVGEGKTTNEPGVCAVRLLVASTQAINLIGKQGTSIKAIQEGSGAVIRVISGDDLPSYASAEERIVEIQGESLSVLKALEAVVKHLRKFLVDHSVVSLFEKSMNKPVSQDQPVDAWGEQKQAMTYSAQQTGIGNIYPPSLKRDSLFLERETQLESQISHSGLSLYGQDPALSLRPSGLGRPVGGLITQITQTMQIPSIYAEDIIGSGGGNIAYIRRTSGAVLSIQESRGMPDEITVEIKGTSTQVQTAQQLIEDSIAGHKEPAATGGYGGLNTGMRPSFSELANTAYSSSSFAAPSYGGYGSSGLGGYDSYRY